MQVKSYTLHEWYDIPPEYRTIMGGMIDKKAKVITVKYDTGEYGVIVNDWMSEDLVQHILTGDFHRDIEKLGLAHCKHLTYLNTQAGGLRYRRSSMVGENFYLSLQRSLLESDSVPNILNQNDANNKETASQNKQPDSNKFQKFGKPWHAFGWPNNIRPDKHAMRMWGVLDAEKYVWLPKQVPVIRNNRLVHEPLESVFDISNIPVFAVVQNYFSNGVYLGDGCTEIYADALARALIYHGRVHLPGDMIDINELAGKYTLTFELKQFSLFRGLVYGNMAFELYADPEENELYMLPKNKAMYIFTYDLYDNRTFVHKVGQNLKETLKKIVSSKQIKYGKHSVVVGKQYAVITASSTTDKQYEFARKNGKRIVLV